jgi:hypothetical protein
MIWHDGGTDGYRSYAGFLRNKKLGVVVLANSDFVVDDIGAQPTGRDCRVILTGDPHQIDVPYLDKLSNGLTYAADRLGQEDFTAVVPLTKGERSRMATRAAELL